MIFFDLYCGRRFGKNYKGCASDFNGKIDLIISGNDDQEGWTDLLGGEVLFPNAPYEILREATLSEIEVLTELFGETSFPEYDRLVSRFFKNNKKMPQRPVLYHHFYEVDREDEKVKRVSLRVKSVHLKEKEAIIKKLRGYTTQGVIATEFKGIHSGRFFRPRLLNRKYYSPSSFVSK